MEKAMEQYELNEIVLALVKNPPHTKVTGATLDERKEMVGTFVKDKKNYRVVVTEKQTFFDIGKEIGEKSPRAEIHLLRVNVLALGPGLDVSVP